VADLEGITVVPEPTEERLGQRQLFEYRDTREQCLSWLLARGKAPDRASGYARSTVKCRAYRIDQFYRWVWDDNAGYTTNVGHEEADRWLEAIAQQNKSAAHKNNCLKAVQMLLKWREHEHGLDPYEPALRFEQEPATQPRDYLTREKRGAIRDAALEYGAIPAYDGYSV
jgi:site-specific recombinase XerD